MAEIITWQQSDTIISIVTFTFSFLFLPVTKGRIFIFLMHFNDAAILIFVTLVWRESYLHILKYVVDLLKLAAWKPQGKSTYMYVPDSHTCTLTESQCVQTTCQRIL